MRESAIEDHAVVGDGRSAALVDRGGSVDWLCWPRFDSPAVLAGILDADGGGRLRLAPAGRHGVRRSYLEGTNVLESRFEAAAGILSVRDAMTLGEARPPSIDPEHELLRLATCLRGEVEVEIEVDLRPGYGRQAAAFRAAPGGFRAPLGRGALVLRSDAPLARGADGAFRGRARLRGGDELAVSLSYDEEAPGVLPPLGPAARERLGRTAEIWRAHVAQVRFEGPHRAAVMRSALALSLLHFAPSGAVVAAPTTSLPERVGGDLNWDYRYCWPRDAALVVRALYGLGLSLQAENFVGWLLHSTRLTRPRLHVLYDVFGRRPRRERTLGWLAGHLGSHPVREGNAAESQLQLDVYGEVVDAVTQVARRGVRFDHDTRRMLRGFGDYVCDHWRDPDSGIWEPREAPRQRTHSIAMCWTALARLCELDAMGALPQVPLERYRREMHAMHEAIETRGFDPALGSYVSDLDGHGVDAALLLLGWYGYAPTTSARMRGTWRAVRRRLDAGGGLLYRYEPSRAAGEGAFGACGFWGVEHLASGGGTLEEAEASMEAQLRHANDVGLFAEEVDPATGAALGNFPQAFTHVGLVSAALSIAERARTEAAGRSPAGGAPGAEVRA